MPHFLRRLFRDDSGSMTILSLYFLTGLLAVSAISVDFAYLLAARNQLQVAADAAAHAAIYYRETNSSDASKLKAVELAQHSMPEASYGAVLRAEDVEFGHWDYETRTFTPNPYSMEAVRVRPGRTAARGNAVTAHLFRFIDEPFWDLAAQAVFVTFDPHCFREGFVGNDVVDIQSNNGFEDGFCVHSNRYVSVNSNNTWEAGTVVSMPDSTEIDLPRSGFVSNEGLQAALRNGYYRLRILNKLDRIYDDLYMASGNYLPDYVSGSAPIVISDWQLDSDSFLPGRVHRVNCGSHDIQVAAGTVMEHVVMITDCPVKFGQGVTLQDSVIFTRSYDDKSIYAASSLQIGKNDSCAEGGGAQIITFGGLDVPSDLRFFGGQVIAKGAVNFSANAGGIQGASIVSGSTISGTSNMTMGFCGSGMEDNFEVSYFRLAY